MMTPSDYLTLYNSAAVDPKKKTELDYICRVILNNHGHYKTVEMSTSIPWFCIATIHFRESDQNFTKHLHNGDPLSARTVHVPAGRPKIGEPPFDWTVSAIDALKGIWRARNWDLPGVLEFLERYNGIGYQKHGINTPYLWDYTDKYVSGLFVSDGSLDPNKKESRAGCVAIIKTLEARCDLGFLKHTILH